MNLVEAMLERKIPLSFEEKKIGEREIGFLLHCATHAPSAGEQKPWEFVVLQGKETREEVAKLALQDRRIVEASVAIVVCIDYEKLELRYAEKKEEYANQDVASVANYLLLAAKVLGYDAVWIRAFEKEKIQRLLNLPSRLLPKALVLVGKAKEFKSPSELWFQNVSHFETFEG